MSVKLLFILCVYGFLGEKSLKRCDFLIYVNDRKFMKYFSNERKYNAKKMLMRRSRINSPAKADRKSLSKQVTSPLSRVAKSD